MYVIKVNKNMNILKRKEIVFINFSKIINFWSYEISMKKIILFYV